MITVEAGTKYRAALAECARCRQVRRIRSRRLCRHCYTQSAASDELWRYPPAHRGRDEVLDEWAVLRLRGLSWAAAAEVLGMRPEAFDRALWRARAAGDPRATFALPQYRSYPRDAAGRFTTTREDQ